MAIKVHLSVDDVIYPLMELKDKMPESVFDISFFSLLKEMNTKYDACFTLYVYENYAETFFINDVPAVYWTELAEAGFIKIGFHGTFFTTDDETLIRKCDNFYSVIPQELRTSILRLHMFQASEAMLDALKRYDVRTLLCRDVESRNRADFPPSYILSEDDEKALGTSSVLRNGMSFIKTDLMIEFFERRQLSELFSDILNSCGEDKIISVFTHEKKHKELAEHIEDICATVHNRSNACFIF